MCVCGGGGGVFKEEVLGNGGVSLLLSHMNVMSILLLCILMNGPSLLLYLL